MDEILREFAGPLGAFAPAAFLGWWIIRELQRALAAERGAHLETIKTKDARIEKLTDQVITMGSNQSAGLTEIRAALRDE